MGCPKCGIKIEPHINVCRNCGENLVKYKINELTKALDKATEEGITHITRASIDMIKEINLRDINEEQYSELTKLMIKLLEKTGILTYVEKKEKIELGEEKKKILNAIEAKMNDAEIVFKKPVGGVEIYLKLGNRALDNELYEKALEYYDKALSIVPNHAFAWCSRGTALGDLGRYDEAIDSFEKALSIAPNYALAWYNKGIAFERLGRHDEAIDSFEKTLSIAPNYTLAWYNKGLVLEKLGRYDEAIDSFDKALSIDPNYALAWYNKGIVLGKLGRHAEAFKCFDRALSDRH